MTSCIATWSWKFILSDSSTQRTPRSARTMAPAWVALKPFWTPPIVARVGPNEKIRANRFLCSLENQLLYLLSDHRKVTFGSLFGNLYTDGGAPYCIWFINRCNASWIGVPLIRDGNWPPDACFARADSWFVELFCLVSSNYWSCYCLWNWTLGGWLMTPDSTKFSSIWTSRGHWCRLKFS